MADERDPAEDGPPESTDGPPESTEGVVMEFGKKPQDGASEADDSSGSGGATEAQAEGEGDEPPQQDGLVMEY